MKQNEVLDWLGQGHNLRYDSSDFSECAGVCVVKNLLPFPVILPDSLQSSMDIDVLDEAGQVLGWLCCCRYLGQVDTNTLSDAKYAAYINEVTPYPIVDDFAFAKDYLVIEVARYDEYKTKYLDTAPVWGGFLHAGGAALHDSYKRSLLSINAISGISFPTVHHVRSSAQSVVQPYGFERFLKLYHLLELLFDFDLVKEIQGLGDDLYGIGKIMASYQREELGRLKALMRKRCTSGTDNTDRVASLLNGLQKKPEYFAKGRELFYDYGKDGNPLSDVNKFDELFKAGGFSDDNAKTVRLSDRSRPYAYLITDVASYWIYRIRCSVVHNRIGEYVMTDDDEEFVVEFAEPLIRELLCQAFRK